METIYLVIVIALVVLAIIDLTVGVANDAANFLNSAIGSKVSASWVILTVASVGLIAGTLTSNGLMEIARSGVFHPGMFTFHDVMIIFLAVMICDVIMLDLFNAFGMPTSTTVSLIFELLGAAVLVALYKIWTSDPETIGALSEYINSARAMTLISAILASVVIAFVFGTVIMFLSRMLFSFSYKTSFARFGALYAGLCLTAIAYFAVFKGLRFTTGDLQEAYQWISANTQLFLGICFIGSFVLMAILQHLFKINILKIIVLAGTFSLAMAFAGSDLANFIGVTMGGVDSFLIANNYAKTGGDVSTLLMSELAKPVHVHKLILMSAGTIMVLAIWFSKKARSVTETGVRLSRQEEGYERFGSIPASRAIVRGSRALAKSIEKITPKSVERFIDNRLKPLPDDGGDNKDKPAFDLVRATVNITVAALLISTATSMKLTLSTTYVTFMVAMGASLADRAWGRESAVYRITGVLTIISGWFLTALIAFTSAGLIALFMIWGGWAAIIIMFAICGYMLWQSSQWHKKHEKTKKQIEDIPSVVKESSVIEQCNEEVYKVFKEISHIYSETLNGLATEDNKLLKQLYTEAKNLYQTEKSRKDYEMLPTLMKLQEDAVNTGHYYIQVVNYLYEVSKSLLTIVKSSSEYIDNNHTGLNEAQIADLQNLSKEVSGVYESIAQMLRTSDFSNFDETLAKRDDTFDLFVSNIKSQIKRAKKKENSVRNSILYLDIINETKAMMLQARNIMKAQRLFVGHELAHHSNKKAP